MNMISKTCIFIAALAIGCGGESFGLENSTPFDDAGDSETSETDVTTDAEAGQDADAGIDSNTEANADAEVDADVGTDVIEEASEDSSFDVDSDTNDADIDSDAEDDTGTDVENDVICSPNMQSDPLHCGYCNHSCEGGSCTDGKCEPVAIAAAESPGDIVSDDDNVYWIHYNGVTAKPKHGGQTEQIAAMGGSDGSLVFMNGNLYFSSKGANTIRRYDTVSKGTSDVVTGVNDITSLAIDSGYIYGIEFVSENNTANSIFKASLFGSGSQQLTVPNHPTRLAVDDTHIYFGDLVYDGIMKMPKAAGSFVMISEFNPVRSVVLDDTNIYWTNEASPDAGVYRIAKTGPGSSAREKIADATDAWGLVLYNQYLYWTDKTVGSVNKVSIMGGSNEVLAVNQSGPRNIHVDEHAVYWSNYNGDVIMKLVK